MLGRVREALADPVLTLYSLRGRWDHSGLFKRYAQLSRRAGIDRLYFILSFDCDTPEDIRVVSDVHSRLTDLGVMPVYAVPGQLLERGDKVYRRIAETGAEFINHGYSEHACIDKHTGTTVSCFFYDQLPLARISEDISNGDKVLREVLGISVKGFRAPHFGTFQKPHQLLFLHSVLKELGYEFSSSTGPYYGFRYGAMFERFGVKEFPVSGMWTSPLNILDTWGCYRAPGRTMGEADYLREGKAVARYFNETRSVGILNYYADPSHIAGSESFFETVMEWARSGRNSTYQLLLQELYHAKA